MLDLHVGQKVWIKRIGIFATNLDRRNAPIEDYIIEDEVTHVGRLLFRVKNCHYHKKFDIETGYNYQKIHRYLVYTNKSDIYKEEAVRNLASKLALIINREMLEELTLTALQNIESLLDERS